MDTEALPRSALNTTIEIRFKDFLAARSRVIEDKYLEHKNSDQELKADICVYAFPDGSNRDSVGWLVVVPEVSVTCIHRPTHSWLTWIVSVIDIEGKSRFPQSFERVGGRGRAFEHPSDEDFRNSKYLARSFILSRSDEFLLAGTLTLRCDIYLSWCGMSFGFPSRRIYDRTRSPFQKFFDLLPQRSNLINPSSCSRTSDEVDIFTLFDLASPVFTSPQFVEFIERFGLYGGALNLPSNSESVEDIHDVLEHVWLFETRGAKFILSLDERKDTVGTRLLRASPLVRQCVEAPMREQRDKSVVFSDIDSQTFKIVLYFLAVGTLREFEIQQLVDVYKFSHLYEMEDLQKRCAEYMAEEIEPDGDCENGDFEVLEEIARLYSDRYLSELLESRRRKCENLEREFQRLNVDD